MKEILFTSAPIFFSADSPGLQLSSASRSALTGSRLALLLRYADCNSIHWSLERRAPFLTNDLVKLLFSMLEDCLLSDNGEPRRPFRVAKRWIFPDKIPNRHDKIGFVTPGLAWLQALVPKIDDSLAFVKELPFLDCENIVAMLPGMLAGKKRFIWQPWRLISFCSWN